MGTGKKLLARAVQCARELGYKEVVLDTLPNMDAARGIYREYGFREIEAYYATPVAGTTYILGADPVRKFSPEGSVLIAAGFAPNGNTTERIVIIVMLAWGAIIQGAHCSTPLFWVSMEPRTPREHEATLTWRNCGREK